MSELEDFQASPEGQIEHDVHALMTAIDRLTKASFDYPFLVARGRTEIGIAYTQLARLVLRTATPRLEAAE